MSEQITVTDETPVPTPKTRSRVSTSAYLLVGGAMVALIVADQVKRFRNRSNSSETVVTPEN